MKTTGNCIFLLIFMATLVMAQRVPGDFQAPRFGFNGMDINTWMNKFCTHFCDPSMSVALRTFSLCSIKCPTTTTTEKSSTSDTKATTPPASSSTSSDVPVTPSTTMPSVLRESNNGGTVIVVDKSTPKAASKT